MAQPHSPLPVKLVAGMISRFDDAFQLAEAELPKRFGPVDSRSPEFPFDLTDYYNGEMGGDLKRRFLSFVPLVMPDDLADIKLQANQIEHDIATVREWPVQRPINIDPGYINSSKLVLATAKDYSHRIYIGRGIYGEVTLRFTKGRFEPWSWTYPDYRTEGYLTWFAEVRDLYLAQTRNLKP